MRRLLAAAATAFVCTAVYGQVNCTWTPSSTTLTTINCKVGVGTTVPDAPLDVRWSGTDFNYGLIVGSTTAANPTGVYLRTTGLASVATVTGGQMQLTTGGVQTNQGIRIDGSGNVGIGTTAPGTALEVRHGSGNTALTLGSTWGTGETGILFRAGTTARLTSMANLELLAGSSTKGVVLESDGNVAIGAQYSDHPLDLRGPSDRAFPDTPATMMIVDENSYTQAGGGILFAGKYTSSGAAQILGAFSVVKENTIDGDYAGALVFGTRANGSGFGSMERMRIASSGEVSIGKSGDSGSKLKIYGDVTATGRLGAKYQDVAEWVPSIGEPEPGAVVIVAPDRRNVVMPSAEAYDTRVAGVVSAQPGLVLGEAGASKVQVATTGRVKVKVDATKAPIHAGDLLVTSDKRGMAMKSEPLQINGRKFHQPGTVVGKALEPLESGTGEILVLLSMQ